MLLLKGERLLGNQGVFSKLKLKNKNGNTKFNSAGDISIR